MTDAPHQLWARAKAEHPDDDEKRRTRYLALMIEHGHVVRGKGMPLPCGWPHFSTVAESRRR